MAALPEYFGSLLRSMEALNRQALHILRLFGNTEVKRVSTAAGPEQEYFLVDAKLWEQRRDLRFTGRTLFGARPPKGQEMDDHSFGTVKPRVAAYMEDLNEELWKLGILAKTQHNEVAPAQHELAPIYSTTNVSADRNRTSHGVYTRAELVSRYEVTLDNYCKTIVIEARTMADMARTEILPAIQAFAGGTARAAAGKRALSPGCAGLAMRRRPSPRRGTGHFPPMAICCLA